MKAHIKYMGNSFAFALLGDIESLIDEAVAEGYHRERFEVDDSEAKAMMQEAELSQKKRKGEVYAKTGVTVPFTSQDAMGLLQVKAAFELGAASTIMLFSNGQKLPMTAEDFPAFAVWFTQKRNSFFQEA